MQIDYRDHALFHDAAKRMEAWLRPGTGQAPSIAQLAVSPDGRKAAGAASVCEKLEGLPSTRIALVDLASGEMEVVTQGPRSDCAPKWSPDGRTIAFLSDREQAYVNRLRLFDTASSADRETPAIDGFVEYLEWSADGKEILLGVADFGSDLAGAQGAFAVSRQGDERPAWAPTVEGMPERAPWRSVWLYDIAGDAVRRVTPQGINVWGAVWCGRGRIGAICSDKPDETYWYSADVRLIDIATQTVRALFKPRDQLGWLAASPSGAVLAVVEAVCSDRNIVAGDVRVIDIDSGAIAMAATLDADVVQLAWRDETHLLFAAARGPDSLIGLLDRGTGTARELWRERERTAGGGYFPEVAPLGRRPSDVLFLREGFFEPPVLIALEDGTEREIRGFGTPGLAEAVIGLGSARDVRWTAPDGLLIEGWVLVPPGPGPHPVVLQVHGGPVWFYRPQYLGRALFVQMLLASGYAVFQPNPRGSSGRGQEFARHVFGDMGGADTHDYLSGLDALVEMGIADPKRIGVTGGSYGGYMTSWLVTQDQRFAAAVSVAPVTNWVSEHLTCHIPTFCEIFLNDRFDDPAGRYFTRSPVYRTSEVKTPTLNICGALDKITPAGQAVEFHHALQIAGVESALVTYPQEGHGVRTMPAVFDYVARTVDWFSRHMPARA